CTEAERWRNALRGLAARGVPTMIANGRLSDRSFRRYRLVRSALRGVLADVRVFAMRSDEDARRIIALGAPAERVVVTGNLKNDAPADPAGVADLWRRLLGLSRDQRGGIAGCARHARAARRPHRAGAGVAPRARAHGSARRQLPRGRRAPDGERRRPRRPRRRVARVRAAPAARRSRAGGAARRGRLRVARGPARRRAPDARARRALPGPGVAGPLRGRRTVSAVRPLGFRGAAVRARFRSRSRRRGDAVTSEASL